MFLTFVLSGFVLSTGHPPVITVSSDDEPTLFNYGEGLELPIEVTDADGDAITMFYKFDDATEWKQVPATLPLNVIPGSAFAGLDAEEDHSIHLLASDGTLESQPVTFAKRKRSKTGKKARSFLGLLGKALQTNAKRLAKSALKQAVAGAVAGAIAGSGGGGGAVGGGQPPVEEKPAQEQKPPEGEEPPAEGEEPQGVGIPMTIQSLSGNAVGVSYSFDDSGIWSQAEAYPLGQFEVVVPASDLYAHADSGDHKITFRFEEADGLVTEDDWKYQVNSKPAVSVSDTQPLAFTEPPAEPVSLPLAVHDADGDEVSLWYRFDGEGDWTYVPAGLGSNVLPAEAFSGRSGNGFVEIAAWDGYEHSDEHVRIGYSIETEAENDDEALGGLSPAAFAGIIVGGVAVVALAIAIVVVATRKKQESSSTGLIESE